MQIELNAGIVALLAVALLGGCSEEKAPAPEPARVAAREPLAPITLPTSDTLPVGHNRDCGCVRDRQCVVLEEIPGNFETRNLSCRWERPNQVAQCRYEQRFVAQYANEDGSFREVPDPWRTESAPVTRLPNGQWCMGR